MTKKKDAQLKIKVHIIRTKEYKKEDLKKVVDVFKPFDGALEFPYKEDESTQLNDYSLPKIPSKKDLFIYCHEYRKLNQVQQNEFVVLLTSLPNTENWFSHFDETRNIFVQGSDWKKYTKADQKYPIAYSVIENILQSLMDLELSDTHTPSIGCMNDMCREKPEIILKLRTADICEKCLKKMKKKGVDARIVNQGLQIMEGLRIQFLFKKEYNRNIVPCSIEVAKNGKFYIPQIGNMELKLDPLFKTIYHHLLIHLKGIKIDELNSYKRSLIINYWKFLRDPYFVKSSTEKITVTDLDADSTINRLVEPKSKSFEQNKRKLNLELEDQLGKALSHYYEITGSKKKRFKVNLEKGNIRIDF